MKAKKFLALTLAASMTFSLAACGKTEKKKAPLTTEAATSTEATEATASEAEATTEAKAEEETGLKAGDVIIDKNFNDGDLKGFDRYTKGGSVSFGIRKDELNCKISQIGDLDYSNQVFYDGFALEQGVTYTFSFDAYASIDRQIQWRLQMNGGDYHAYVGENVALTSEKQSISYDFTMNESSDPAPRMCFNMGLMDDMSGDPGEHEVTIDNIKLVVKDAGSAVVTDAIPERPDLTTSQVGYKPDDEKLVVTKNMDDTEFEVVNEKNEVVYTGSFGDEIEDVGLKASTKRGDFTEFNEPGKYKVRTENSGETYTFTIDENVYQDVYQASLKMLYLQRCGQELTEEEAGEFAHPICHNTEAVIYGTDKKIDVSGGWHDAGDYGRYVVAGATTIADLYAAYEDFGDQALLDEARYELEWMLKMQDQESGGVYHKVTCKEFPSTVMPQDETDELVVSPISTAATGDFAAVMFKASRLYKESDPEFAEKCGAAAQKAWDYAKVQNPKAGFKNPKDIVTGEYPDDDSYDEQLWAATELLLTGVDDADAKNIISEGFGYNNDKGEWKVKSGLGWATITTFAVYDLAQYSGSDADIIKFSDSAKDKLKERADTMMNTAESSGYLNTLFENYSWGSNMTVANDGMTLLMAAKVFGDESYRSLGRAQLNYLLGVNPLGYCFVTGYGVVSPQHPHHRPSQVKGTAMPGMLVGGPDKNLEDPYAKAVLKGQAPALCYADNEQTYSTNEVTIYWNSPLIYLLAEETQTK